MSQQVYCPHCLAPCLVPGGQLGQPVRCHLCGEAFTLRPLNAADRPRTVPDAPVALRTGPPRLDIGHATSTGRVRDRNEDSLLVQHLVWSNLDERHELALLVVADGMGGYEAGDRASGLVIRTIGASLAPLLGGALSGQFKDAAASMLADTIDFALQEANCAVLRNAQGGAASQGMGATVALALVWDSQVLIGHVGDCRVYQQRGGRLAQITRDQTAVARMLELGLLSPQEARDHPSSSEVTQAIGKQAEIKPSRHRVTLQPGDWLLVACDGLHTHLDHLALQTQISQSAPSAAHLAQQLVDRVNGLGGTDNCTIIAVRCV